MKVLGNVTDNKAFQQFVHFFRQLKTKDIKFITF